ncbi:MAG: hypothetical protein IJT18_06620, partial [Oscillospiraceae bacterium]|nr:hypothetical protein [Oscillospiraceae bacterium]
AKRDYPASIHYQSAWYREYKYLEDHYARINTAMTRGRPLTEIAVVHPVESNWLEYAANDMTGDRRSQLQADYESIWQWLLYAPLDFDYLCESTLPQLCGKTEKPVLPVGEMAYKTVLVAGMETIRSTTVRLLLEFLHRGGRVLIVGAPPKYVDAGVPQADDPLYTLLREAEAVPFQKAALLDALKAHRQVSFRLESGVDAGKRGEDWLYNYRQDGSGRWLFLASGVRMPGAGKKGTYPELDGKQVRITIKGRWKPTLYDTLTGEIKPVGYTLTAHDTVLHRTLWCCDSLLLHLTPASADDTGFDTEEKSEAPYAATDWKRTVAVRRGEPNVLLLDLAEWSSDGESWQPAEELRRIDRGLRQKHPDTKNNGVQPWAIPPEQIRHHILLRFPIRTRIDVDVRLAYEAAEEVLLDGKAVELKPDGWFTDRHIYTAPLPRLAAGEHTLTVRVPFGKRASLEDLFLLGEFDVSLRGVQAELIPCAETCGFGDLAVQGMPFYGGPVTYELPFELQEDADVTLFAQRYAGAVLTAALDGKPCGTVAFPPYRLPLGAVAAGKHTLTVTDWLTRANSFAALHNLTGDLYKGKAYWYPKGDGFAYEYQLMQSGLLLSPRLELRKLPR